MTPEELRALAASVAKALAANRSVEDVNAFFRSEDGIPFQSVQELQQAMQAQGITPQGQAQQPTQAPVPQRQPAQRPGGRGMGAGAATSPDLQSDPRAPAGIMAENGGSRPWWQQAAAAGVQGFTGGFASDALNAAENVGIAPEGTTREFQTALQSGRNERGLLSGAAQTGGMLLGAPRIAATKVLAPAVRGVGNAVGRGAAHLARSRGVGAAGQLAAQGAAGSAGATVAGAGAGVAEGAAMEVGERFGQEDRTEGLLSSPIVLGSGLLGAASFGIGAGVRHLKGVKQATRERGLRLAADAESRTRPLPNRRRVESVVGEADEVRRASFRQFDDTPAEALPLEIPEFVRSNPTARQALRRSQSQEARVFSRALDKYETDLRKFRAGEIPDPPEPPQMSALLADDIRKNLGSTADAFATARPGGDLPDATLVREAQAAEEGLTDLLGSVPGFEEGIQATRQARGVERSFLLGRQARNMGADAVEDLAAGNTVRLGSGTQPVPLQVADVPQGNAAFRAGLIEPEIERLTSNPSTVKGVLDELMPGTQLYRRMRVALGGEENLQAFMREAKQAQQLGDMDKMIETLVKYVGFIGFGSSLAGGAALGSIGG